MHGLITGLVLLAALVPAGADEPGSASKPAMPIDPEFVAGEPEILLDDWLCIPGLRCGPITGATTEADLIEIFGPDNVTREEAWIREGSETVWADIVFRGTDGEFWIYWEESWEGDEEPESISYLQVSSPWTRWHTEQGVVVGTSLEELNAINGTPFLISGYYWGYGGWVQDWCGGSLEGQVLYLRNLSWEGGDYQESFEPVRSDDPALAGQEIVVDEMVFVFDRHEQYSCEESDE